MMMKMVLAFLLLSLGACSPQVTQKPINKLRVEALNSFEVLPASIIDTNKNKDLIVLGKKLYFEKKLSINNSLSCNSCHQLDNAGVDNLPTSPGHEGKLGGRNSPTVYNSGLYFAQFWDGRAENLEAQAVGPILNPVEMGMPNAEAVVAKLSAEKEYLELFKKVFSDGAITYPRVGESIAAFEKTLLTPSRFDDFLKGDDYALTDKEKKGLAIFMDKGCIACHNGPAIGGNSFQKLGDSIEYETKDIGRMEVTKDPADLKYFKVPSLRNITKTFPYFHDGSIKTIEEAIRLMGKHQLGLDLTKEEIDLIKSFFISLNAKKFK